MRTKEMPWYNTYSTSPRLLRSLPGILTSVVMVLAVGVGTPSAAQDLLGTVAGTPGQVVGSQVVAFEPGQFGDIAILCPPAGCRTDFGGTLIQFDENVHDDLGVDTGDRFADHLNVTVRHTFAGHIIGLRRLGSGSPTADIVCFSVPLTLSLSTQTGRRCAKIVEEPSGGTPDLEALVVIKDTTSLCETLASKTVLPTPDIAYVVQLDTIPESSGVENAVRILVCDGYNWVAAFPANFNEDNVTVAGQQRVGVIKTPHSNQTGGTNYR